jgi:hypothetical protein
MEKTYLGDGVYAQHDGYQVWLTTEDGYRTTNAIALDDSTLGMFLRYIDKLRSREEPE